MEVQYETHIGFNLHYIPNTQKIFVYASVGYVTSESDCETYIFGNTFDEMNELVSAFSGMADETFGEDEEPVSAAGEDVAWWLLERSREKYVGS